MTKEPADWAKIKAYRSMLDMLWVTDKKILSDWPNIGFGFHELARMYDKYEQPSEPPVDPDLLAARKWGASLGPSLNNKYLRGEFDGDLEIKAFLAGIKHGRANP